MPTTTIGTFHSAATSTGNGSSLAVPSGDIVLNVSLVGSGPIGAVIQPQVSADNSTWVDLQPSTRIAGAGSVSSMVDVATTAAYIRVVLSEISGTNAAATVTLASFAPDAYASLTLSPDGSALVAPLPVIVSRAAGGIRAHKTYHGDASGGSFAVSTSTGMEQHQALGDFYGFRVFFVNWDTAAKTLGQSIYTLPATTAHNGQGATWVNMYSGGVLTDLVVPASSQGDAGSALSTIPGLLAMDPVFKKNAARTDGGIGPFVSLRSWWAAGSRPGLAGTGVFAAQLALTGVDEVSGNSSGNNRVTTNPQDFGMTMSNAGGAYRWSFVEFYYYAKSIALSSFGDSTMNGYGSTTGFTAGVDICAKLRRANSSLSTIISPAKFGGKSALGTLATLKATIAAGITMDYALIPTWTINDGKTDAAFDLGMGCALEMIQRCKAARITPIVLTPRVNDGLAGSQITRWQEQKAKVLAMAGTEIVCDYTKNMEDPAAPSHFLAALTADGTHQNNAGYAIDGQNLLDTLTGFGIVK